VNMHYIVPYIIGTRDIDEIWGYILGPVTSQA
jgi:hypothetical protein